MMLFSIILSLLSIASPAHVEVTKDIFFTWKGERIACEFVKVNPEFIKLRRTSDELVDAEKFKAKEIQGYRHGGNVILSKKVINDKDSSYIFLPFRKPYFDYRYESFKVDNASTPFNKPTGYQFGKPIFREKNYKVTGKSNGKITFYHLEEFYDEYGSPMMGVNGVPIPVPVDIKTKKYRLFIDEDKKGLSEIPFVKLLGKWKSPQAYEILTDYLADNINLVEKIKADSNKTATWENIEQYIEAYFGESLEKTK